MFTNKMRLKRSYFKSLDNKQPKYPKNGANDLPFYGKFRSKSKKNFAVVIGSTTTVLECLEHHLTVYHVTPVPVLEALDPLFWPKVKINSLDNGIFLYSYNLKKKLINY